MSKNKSWFNSYCISAQRGGVINPSDSRHFNLFKILAIGRFKWENLPNGIESRIIESYLFEHGQVAFFNDEQKGLLCLPISPTGGLNVYGQHLEYNAFGIAYNKIVNRNDLVKIKTNDLALPSILTVNYYADMMSETEKTMYLNLRQQKFPFIMASNKTNELTMKNLYKQIDDFEDVLVVDDKLGNGGDVGIKVVETNAPYLLEDLQKYKNDLYNEFLTWLGLNNTNNDKKERMVVDEVNVNNNHILMNMELEFKNRQLACEEINKKFGLNITVKKTVDDLEIDFIGSEPKTNPKEGE